MTTAATISFRLVEPGDVAMLHGWLERPHVARWWGAPDSLAELAAEFDGRADNPVRGYLALEDGIPFGFVQSYVAARCHAEGWWLEEHDPGVIGIDQFLAEGSRLGQGLGTHMVRAFVDRLLADPGVTRVQVDPAPDNDRAIRCYEKAGFRAEGVVDTPDGPALLMYRDRGGSQRPVTSDQRPATSDERRATSDEDHGLRGGGLNNPRPAGVCSGDRPPPGRPPHHPPRPMMRRSLPCRAQLVTPALLLALAAPLGAQDTSTAGRPAVLTAERYSEPPAELVRLVTAPRHLQVNLSNLSPDRARFLALRSAGMPTVNEMGHRWHNLAGFQVDPQARRARTITTRPNAGLDIVDTRTGRTTSVQLPAGMTVANPAWSPDGSQVAFLANNADGSWLFVADAATGRSRRLSATPVLATAVTDPEWSGDGRGVLAVMVRDDMGAEPRMPTIATGPLVRLTAPGKKNATRTYADLLEDPYDQQLLEHYTTGQLTWVPVSGGAARKIGAPAMIQAVSSSPEGQHLLVTLLQKPFSYTVQVGSFGTEQQLWDLSGKVLATVAKRPMREGDGGDDDPAARAAQDTVKRSVGWLPDASGLFWLQQDPAPKADTAAAPEGEGRAAPSRRRDHLVKWSAPFDAASRQDLLTSTNRIADVLFTPDAKTVFVAENANGTAHVYAVDLADPAKRYTISRVRGLQAQVGTIRQGGFGGGGGRGGTGADSLTFYQDPGVVASYRGPAGEVASVSPDGKYAFLSGTQYSRAWMDSAPRPFVDRIEIRTGQKSRVWQSAADRYEQPTLAADDRIVIQRESATQPPNWFSRSASGQEVALTRNTDATPEITNAPKRMVQVTRPDGYKFWVTVNLPRGYQQGTKLPAIFWFYPYEYTDQAGYDRTKRNFNRNAFPRFGPRSMEYLITQGYAVVEPDAPIVGAQGRMNDNYVSDLRNNLSATIDELDRQGLIDRTRLGLGGHSYGAFSTVNAMVHTPFFKAGIAGDGNYNRTLTPTAFQSERRDLWQARETYLSMSPLLYADRLTGALMMYHGLADQNVGTDPINSRRLFHALLAQGKPAALYMYPYEDHGPVSRETLLDMWSRWTAWLDYYVKNAR